MRKFVLMLALIAVPAAAQTTPPAETTVLARPVAAGDAITADLLTQAFLPRGEASGALDPRQLEGMAARRALPAGRPIRAADIETPRLIRRGEAVRLTITGAGYRINALARALANAGEGELVRLVLASGNRQLDAMVTARGEARISE